MTQAYASYRSSKATSLAPISPYHTCTLSWAITVSDSDQGLRKLLQKESCHLPGLLASGAPRNLIDQGNIRAELS